MTLKYAGVGYTQIYGSFPQETLVRKEVGYLEFTRKGSAYLAFQCILIKDGFRPKHLYQVLEDKVGSTFTQPKLTTLQGGVHKTFTGLLEPISTHISSPQPKAPPIQQQQQQQQQTVVLPGPVEKKADEKGTVHVSSKPENADVFVDGIFVGNSPCKLSLTDGIHIIEIKASGFVDFKRELRVMAGSEVSMRATLSDE
jgi:hypothetical protein